MMQGLFILASSHCTDSVFFGIPHWAQGLKFDSQCRIIDFSLVHIWTVVGNIAQMVLAIAGYLAIIFILIGAFTLITSTGNPEQVKRAKSIITNSVIGLAVAILGITIIRFIGAIF